MIAEKEKAQLIVEILEKFAPYMDKSTDQFKEMGILITSFGELIDSFSELPDEKKTIFMGFIRMFNNYIELASANYSDLREFYSYMAQTTNSIIADYKNSIGIE